MTEREIGRVSRAEERRLNALEHLLSKLDPDRVDIVTCVRQVHEARQRVRRARAREGAAYAKLMKLRRLAGRRWFGLARRTAHRSARPIGTRACASRPSKPASSDSDDPESSARALPARGGARC